MGMKCYYEILNVPQDATDDDLKKSYRKLALKWHPDKNLENAEEAKEQFQLVQQAYEVLSDSQERAWYDTHRDSILKGGLGKDYNDDSLNLYPYFSSSCFKGYGDDEKGFYAVYREVFNKVSAEDSQYDSELDSDDEIPDFGDSNTPYEEKVRAFYSYWQSYATKRSFSWLDEYDTRQAPNRRVARLMEKENKKVRDAARKERNEQIRTLVAFVRKRDKRVQQFAKVLEQRAVEQADKVKQLKLKQRQQRQEEIERQKQTQSEWSKFSNLEKELKEIEENLAAEFNEELSEGSCSDVCDGDEEEEDDVYSGNLYCSACNKLFKTEQAFVNHEKSKKHKEKVEEMSFDDESLESPDEDKPTSHDESLSEKDDDESEHFEDSAEEIEIKTPEKSKKKKKNKVSLFVRNSSDSESEEILSQIKKDSDSDFEMKKSKSKRNRKKADSNVQNVETADSSSPQDKIQEISDSSQNIKSKRKKYIIKNNEKLTQVQQSTRSNGEGKPLSKTDSAENIKVEHTCKACTVAFKSNNELFKHLKKTGHAVPISSGEHAVLAASKGKKRSKK